jgi:hypothetical protein
MLRVALPGFLPHTNTVFPFKKYIVYPISFFKLITLTEEDNGGDAERRLEETT